MDKEQWQKVSEVFNELIDLSDEDQASALSKLAKTDYDIYQAILPLLKEESSIHPALQTNATHPWSVEEDMSLAGTNISIYRLVELIGSGGMGSVFLAERSVGDFDRTVALKLIKPGGIKEDAIRRFRKERQILANLTHPGIARLYDGGESSEGRLFFTMEYVPGNDILSFLADQQADFNQRLELFLSVAKAISYAHAQLVLHLDIKPGNILVDEQGQVKILDFGVAENVYERVGEQDLSKVNQSQQYTLAYGSPEQLSGKPTSTKSDIYSLGVLLYQILTGELPVSPDTGNPTEYKQAVLAANSPLASTASSFPHPSITKPKMAGNMDLILAKAMAKEEGERYASVDQLVSDLEAHLDQKPISLRKDDSLHVVSLFFSRNRAWLSILVIALLGLTVLGSYYTIQLQKERNQAIAEANKNKELLNFVTSIFEEADPFYAQGDTLTVYDLLSQGSHRVDSLLQGEPELHAEMLYTLGELYHGLGDYGNADSMIGKAVDVLERNPTLKPSQLQAKILFLLSNVEYAYGEYEAAEKSANDALGIARSGVGDPGDDCSYLRYLGDLAIEDQQFAKADSLFRNSLSCVHQLDNQDQFQLTEIYHSLGAVNRNLQQFDTAKYYLLKSLRLKEQIYTPPHTEIAYTQNNLASLYLEIGHLDTALTYALVALEQRKKVFGLYHVETVASMGNVSRIYSELGKVDSSLMLAIAMENSLSGIFGGAHPYLLGAISQQGNRYNQLSRFQEGEERFRRGIIIHQQLIEGKGEDALAFQGAVLYHGLSISLFKQKRYQEALTVVKKAWHLREIIGDPGNYHNGYINLTYGEILARLDQKEEARSRLLVAKELLSELPERHKEFLKRVQETFDYMEE